MAHAEGPSEVARHSRLRSQRLPPECRGGRGDDPEPQRWALVVGVGRYRAPEVQDLTAPPSDARAFASLLTRGYGFPERNICLLLDQSATRGSLRQAFESHLISKVAPGDSVVVYFAGHGSQIPDDDGDEADGLDETWLLYDSLGSGPDELRDDDIHDLLSALSRRLIDRDHPTPSISLVLDSCHSGSASRGEAGDVQEPSAARVRYHPLRERPAPEATSSARAPGREGAGPGSLLTLPGVTVLAAAQDNQRAYEQEGRGIFTEALLRAAAASAGSGARYSDVWPEITQLVAARSVQLPRLSGDVDGPVFGASATQETRPSSWEIRAQRGDRLTLEGPPLPGYSPGALLRIHRADALPRDLRDPGASKAELLLEKVKGVQGEGVIVGAVPGAGPPKAGDRAVLVTPGDDLATLRFRLSLEGPGALPAAWVSALRHAVEEDLDTRDLLQEAESGGSYVISLDPALREVVLRGPEGQVRALLGDPTCACSVEAARRGLWQFARQQLLLQLRGEGGDQLQNDRSLQLSLVPAEGLREGGAWRPPVQGLQSVPACASFRVAVRWTDSQSAADRLSLGILVLSNDGAITTEEALLSPGGRIELPKGEPLTSCGPFYAWDHVLAIGHLSTQKVDWSVLNAPPVGPSRSLGQGLSAAFDTYLTRGWRGAGPDTRGLDTTLWTTSHLQVLVEQNPSFTGPSAALREIYGDGLWLKNFDPTPYLGSQQPPAWTALLRTLMSVQAQALSSETTLGEPRQGADPLLPFPVLEALPSGAQALTSLTTPTHPPCNWSELRAGDLVLQEVAGYGPIATLVIDPDLGIGWGKGPNLDGAPSSGGFRALLEDEAWAELGAPPSRAARCGPSGVRSPGLAPVGRVDACPLASACHDVKRCFLGSQGCRPLSPVSR